MKLNVLISCAMAAFSTFADDDSISATASSAVPIDTRGGDARIIGSSLGIGYDPSWSGVTNAGAYVKIEKVEHVGMFNVTTSVVAICATDASGVQMLSPGTGDSPCVRLIHRVYSFEDVEIGSRLVRDVAFGCETVAGSASKVDCRASSLQEAVAAHEATLAYSTLWATNAVSLTISATLLSGQGGTPVSSKTLFSRVANAEGDLPLRGLGSGWWRLTCSIADASDAPLLEYETDEFLYKSKAFILIVR